MNNFRDVDVLVAGGGPSGVAAAIAAARRGANTLIVERYGRLGGAGVTSMVNPLMGRSCSPLVGEVLERFEKVQGDWEVLDLVYADMIQESGAGIMLHSWVVDPLMDGRRVTGIRVLNKQGLLSLGAKVVIDATADGDVAFKAGAEYEKGREGDGLLQPMTIMYRLGGVDKSRALLCGNEEEAFEIQVPEGSWHEVVQRGGEAGELPRNIGIIRTYESPHPGERIVNATQVNYVDGTNIEDLTRAELEGRRQALAVTKFLQQHAPGYEDCYIAQMPQSIGVRETRRFLGEEYLTKDDLVSGRKWKSAVVRDADFVIDIHNPEATSQAQAEGFAARVQPYDIPYGCLVPREIDGLLLSGRCISGSHEAHASYRVQQIVMAIGAAAGTAAAIAAQNNSQPREIDVSTVQEKLGLMATIRQ
ncbi:MAG: FAD-dependent oxidoreductase [Armatimonadetes bacterium]|nr:FAD-dependent oxidoreductase [Armatimonadota bacterium]